MAELLDGPRPYDSPSIPSWDDTLHVRPRRAPTPQQLVELVRAARGADDSQLSAADKKFLHDRRVLLERAQASGVPYWRQVMTGVLTTLDNVQDILATSAWMGGPLLRRLGQVGAYLHGGLKESATALNTIERGLGGPLPTGRAKHQYMNQRQANARTRTGLLGGVQRGMSWFEKNQGHLLEAAQASDTLFGVGLTLGAIMGALDATYQLTGQKFGYELLTANRAIWAELPFLSPAERAGFRDQAEKYAAAGQEVPSAPPIEWLAHLSSQLLTPSPPTRTWEAWAHMGDIGAIALPIDDGDIALVALSGAGVNLAVAPAVKAIAETLSDRDIANLLVPPPRVKNHVTRALLETFGAPIDQSGIPGADWAGPQITLEEHTNQTIGRWLKSEKPWLPADPSSPRAQLIHQLVEANAPATAALLAGDASAYQDRAGPEDQLLFHAIELHTMPPSWASREQLEQWATHMLDAQGVDPDAWHARSFQELNADFWSHQARPEHLIGR